MFSYIAEIKSTKEDEALLSNGRQLSRCVPQFVNIVNKCWISSAGIYKIFEQNMYVLTK